MPDDVCPGTKATAEVLAEKRKNESAVLDAERAGSARVDALPMKFTFEFTGDCNLHCFFCDCEFSRNEFRKRGITKFAMDEATFRLIAENAFPKATVVNPTVIGEPLTFPYFDIMLDYAEKYGVKLEIITNGMLLKGPRVERMLPLLDRLTISFDGGTKETFEKCRTGSKFDVVIENLRRFRDLRRSMGLEKQVKFIFGTTLMHENVLELPRILEWAHELEATEVCSAHLLVFTEDLKGSSLFEHRELSNRAIAAGHEASRRLGIRLSAPVPFDLGAPAETPIVTAAPDETNPAGIAPRQSVASERADGRELVPHRIAHEYSANESPRPDWAKERLWCKFAWREVFISIGGDVAPCCQQGRPVVGNAFKQNWDEIWNGEQYQAIRRGLYDKAPTPFCSKCPMLAEQGWVPYQEAGFHYRDRYPEQTRADIRPVVPERTPKK